MYWPPKRLKDSIGAGYIVASKKCTKFIPKAVSKSIKLIFHQIKVYMINNISIIYLSNFGL